MLNASQADGDRGREAQQDGPVEMEQRRRAPIPLRIAKAPDDAGAAPEAVADRGRVYLRFGAPVHPFAIDRETLVMTDRDGNPLPFEARFDAGSRTVVIDPLGPERAAA